MLFMAGANSLFPAARETVYHNSRHIGLLPLCQGDHPSPVFPQKSHRLFLTKETFFRKIKNGLSREGKSRRNTITVAVASLNPGSVNFFASRRREVVPMYITLTELLALLTFVLLLVEFVFDHHNKKK